MTFSGSLEQSQQVVDDLQTENRPLPPPITPLQVKPVTHQQVPLWHWQPNTRTFSLGLPNLLKCQGSNLARGSEAPGETGGISSSAEKNCRHQPQDGTDDFSVAWEHGRRRGRMAYRSCCEAVPCTARPPRCCHRLVGLADASPRTTATGQCQCKMLKIHNMLVEKRNRQPKWSWIHTLNVKIQQHLKKSKARSLLSCKVLAL